MYKDITNQVWSYVMADKNKESVKVLNKLNYDIARFYNLDNEKIIIEPVTLQSNIPNYLYNYIIKHNDNIIDWVIYLDKNKNQVNNEA